ncbi:type I methionyl aminopeptidase [Inconstantimicrobium porci]|uniref:Methionine aminopeptidase n=1 Tax=Inconstantimicrobium porci TaxID=2652291 RepID=A0A7X2T0R4_9CLOT|nr:type I methionyl aminopeptidase [Inconstantimicrobium porci]MDD6770011.1 type I methionyl aminopeptidase [Inconstantimicrobium porci]MSR90435.1 type I methionyl aminopeptidase [Inconstantimicrobium porci]
MIIIKNNLEIDLMRKAGRLLAETLLRVEDSVKPGITTAELNKIAEDYIVKHGGKPSFKGLYGFPAAACISVNEQVIHGFPSKYVLQDGDLISIDCGVCLNGYQSDAARTFMVGNVSDEAKRLVAVTKESFFKGIEFAKPGNRLSDISNAIQTYVEGNGFSVVRDYVGHGIGRDVHEDPDIPNYGRAGRGPILQEGMTLAIEPMVNVGTHKVITLDDEWTVVTADKKLSAHYENTVAILTNGPEILTLV